MTGGEGRVVVVGDALLDRDVDGRVERLCPDAPVPVVDTVGERVRPGGAGLAAALAAADGRPVTLVTALARDRAGADLAGLLEEAGVEVVDLGLDGPTPEKVRVRSEGRALLRLDRGGAGPTPVGPWSPEADAALAAAAAVLVADYGRGLPAEPGARRALARLPRRVPLVWDPHPRAAPPVPGARLATPNAGEAARFASDVEGEGLAADTARARALARRWEAAAVAVTRGRRGALLVTGDVPPLVVTPPASADADPCGAGDRFASAATGLMADGALPSEAVAGAVGAASAFVSAGGLADVGRRLPGEQPPPAPAAGDALVLAGQVRARGGTVVAAGGCFDLLHAGHVALLRSARALGDCLVVCLNSDASVRRLKGPDRPLVNQADRAAVLVALECVDAVAVFDEDTPLALLERLRPDVFAKGADYAVPDLPEAALLARWGGQAVVLPYLEGRSTTGIVREAMSRARR